MKLLVEWWLFFLGFLDRVDLLNIEFSLPVALFEHDFLLANWI